jgi:hypothetical protein
MVNVPAVVGVPEIVLVLVAYVRPTGKLDVATVKIAVVVPFEVSV